VRSILSYSARSHKAQGHFPQAQRFTYLSVACLTPVRKAPSYFILARAARLSPHSLQALFILGPLLFTHSSDRVSLTYLGMRLCYPRDAVDSLWTKHFAVLESAHVCREHL